MMLPVLLLCTVTMVSTQPIDKDVGEYGYYNTARKATCEKNNPEMYEELEGCFKKEHERVVNATEKCVTVADPALGGSTVQFYMAACKDISIFRKFDECFDEYIKDEDFKNLMEITPDVLECYKNVLKKYEMDSLLD